MHLVCGLIKIEFVCAQYMGKRDKNVTLWLWDLKQVNMIENSSEAFFYQILMQNF